MASQGWDPGIGYGDQICEDINQDGNQEDFNRRTSSNFEGFDGLLEKETFRIHEIPGFTGVWISVSIIIKMESTEYPGIIFEANFLTKVGKELSYCEFYGMGKIRHNGDFGYRSFQNRSCGIESNEISLTRFGIIKDLSWGVNKEVGTHYKNIVGIASFCINLFHPFTSKYKGFILVSCIMTHGQIMGSMGGGRNGEGHRKRLKISVPHFDNTALIKTFSRTLIGRCMNPGKQVMALLSNIPKIWKLEDKVNGKDFWTWYVSVLLRE